MLYTPPHIDNYITASHFSKPVPAFIQEVEEPYIQFPDAEPSAIADPSIFWQQESSVNELQDFESLPENWDGYGASAFASETIKSARQFINVLYSIPQPFIMPHPAGTITLEWDSSFGEACLEIGRTRYSFYLKPRAGKAILRDGISSELLKDANSLINIVRGFLFQPQAQSAPTTRITIGLHRNEQYSTRGQ